MLSTLSPDHNLEPEGDAGLETLLNLNGEIYEVGGGYWVKIEAEAVPADVGRPRGIVYSLTLHSRQGDRLIGFDNSHPVRKSAGPGGAAKPPFDHEHKRERAKPYEYTDAAQLLTDFWEAVELTLREEGVS